MFSSLHMFFCFLVPTRFSFACFIILSWFRAYFFCSAFKIHWFLSCVATFIFIAVYYDICHCICYISICVYMIYVAYISLYWSISIISTLWLFKQCYCDSSCSCVLALMSKTFSSVCITRNGMLCLRIQVSLTWLSKPNSFPIWYLNEHSHSAKISAIFASFKMLLWCGYAIITLSGFSSAVTVDQQG